MDSNFRYRGRRPASGRSLRAQRVETDAAKREFGSGSCLFAPPWGGSGGLGGGLCFPFPTPGNGQQESRLAPIGRLLRRGVLRTGCFPRQAARRRERAQARRREILIGLGREDREYSIAHEFQDLALVLLYASSLAQCGSAVG